MAYFALSGITGCISPSSGETSTDIYGVMYNDSQIISYYKKDKVLNFITTYMVVVVFQNYTQQYHFLTSTDRDAFYVTLP